MKLFSNQKVENLLRDIQSQSVDRYNTGMAIRELFYKLKNNLSEDVMYGGLMFYCNQEMMSGIFFYKEHISIEFGKGSEFNDLNAVLEGKGKFRRHIKIFNIEEIESKKIETYIQQAIDKS